MLASPTHAGPCPCCARKRPSTKSSKPMYSRVRRHHCASLLSWRADVFDGVMLCSCCVSTVQRHAAAAEQSCHASRCCFCCSGLMVLDQYYCAVTCESSVRFDLLWTSSCRRVWFALPNEGQSSIGPRSSFAAPVGQWHGRESRACRRSVGYVIQRRASLGSVPPLTCRRDPEFHPHPVSPTRQVGRAGGGEAVRIGLFRRAYCSRAANPHSVHYSPRHCTL